MPKLFRRILFVTPPGHGHIFPLISIAWAFRAAGHEVLIATCGISLSLASHAGLSHINVAPGQDLLGMFERHKHSFPQSFARPLQSDDASPSNSNTGSFFIALGDAMADGLVQAALKWRAEVIIFTPEAAAGPVAATKLGIPSVFLGIGLAHTPQSMVENVYPKMNLTSERHGLANISAPAAWIDVAPKSLKAVASNSWPMRYVPYNGGSLLPLVPSVQNREPRIAVTLGTVVPLVYGWSPLHWLTMAAQHVDAEFVIVCGSSGPSVLGELPANVKTIGWFSLNELLITCNGVIHHGGWVRQ